MRRSPVLTVLVIIALVAAVAAIIISLVAPSLGRQTFSGTLVRNSIQQMSVLTTTRFNYTYAVRSESEMPALLRGLYGQQQLLMAVGSVTAGIDLTQLQADDVVLRDDGTLIITVPPAKLLDCFLDESATYVVERSTGIFASSSPTLDQSSRRYAVGQFREAAFEQNIFAAVQEQTVLALTEFIRALGANEVTQIEFVHDAPSAEIPSTCSAS